MGWQERITMNNKLVKKTIEYLGLTQPSTRNELNVEIAGLLNVIKQAEELISRHKQSLAITLMILEDTKEDK
jgi:hypothetical protein